MRFSELDETQLLDRVKPLAEHTENAWNGKNYEDFCKYLLVEPPERQFPEDEFNRQIAESYDVFGEHQIGDLVAIHQNPDNVVVLWKVKFEKRIEPGLLMYCFTEHNGSLCIDGCTYHA